MGVAIAYNPCGWCPYKENGERCEMCELTFRRKEWISVEERLPEKDGKYLCYMLWKNGTGWFECLNFGTNLEKASGCFDGVERSGFYYFDPDWGDVETKEVTHWMPLPEPPKKGGAE